jgi:hypothetical protein
VKILQSAWLFPNKISLTLNNQKFNVMKHLLSFIFCICLAMAASAQLNSDSSGTVRHTTADQMRNTSVRTHLHPKVQNIANPETSFDIDGGVYRNEAIINRHATSLSQLIR